MPIRTDPEDTSDRAKFDLDFRSIHEKIYPADVRPHDRILSRIRKRSDNTYIDCRVWKMSPLGVELVFPESSSFEKGDQIDLDLTIAGERSHFQGLVVDLIQENPSIRLIGIRLSKRTHRDSASDRRTSPRWLCSDDFFPSCISPSTVRMHDYIHFQIRDISKNGFLLTCSLRNKFLVAGMTLNLAASFPMVGELILNVRIVRVGITSEGGKDHLSLGTEFINPSKAARNLIAQYLVQFSNADSVEVLRTHDYKPDSISRGVNFSFLKTEEDYQAVLELRHMAHIADGNFADGISPNEMGDINDARARIIVGKYRDAIVATARIRFNDIDTPLEHESYVDIPTSFPHRNQIQEISRVCTHPDFRRSDLLVALFHFTASTSLSPDRPWYLVSSWKSMIDFYNRIGFEDTGLSHKSDMWKEKQHVLLGNAVDAMLGKNTDPLYWNIVWQPVSDYLIETGVINPTKLDRVRILALKFVGKVSKVYLWYRKRPRTRKRR